MHNGEATEEEKKWYGKERDRESNLKCVLYAVYVSFEQTQILRRPTENGGYWELSSDGCINAYALRLILAISHPICTHKQRCNNNNMSIYTRIRNTCMHSSLSKLCVMEQKYMWWEKRLTVLLHANFWVCFMFFHCFHFTPLPRTFSLSACTIFSLLRWAACFISFYFVADLLLVCRAINNDSTAEKKSSSWFYSWSQEAHKK